MSEDQPFLARTFEERVLARLAEWNARYEAAGSRSASPLMDRIIAEQQVAEEMEIEARGN